MPSRREAFRYWLHLGLISFGGPAGQIAIMHRELVDERRWISEARFLHALNYCMVLPGPEAQQLATYIGWLMHRTWGGIVAGGLFVLPSLVLLVVLSWLYVSFGGVPWVAAALDGVKPAVVAIVLHAAWRIGTRTLRHPVLFAIALAAFVAIFALHVPFPWVIVSAGLVGALGARVLPAAFTARPAAHAHRGPAPAAVIDDDTPTPAHARFRAVRLGAIVATGVLLCAGAMALLAGVDATLFDMAAFFGRAALLTFGGAYAVLPYVFQGAVESHGWLTAAQMIDGLALGETTPGPLIMVVAFVGYVGAAGHALTGLAPPTLAGIAGAGVATFFTFLPSFIFILAGGPLVESTHGRRAFVAPLTGITAAVVGVIASLAAFFAAHVLWPAHPWIAGPGGIDIAALAIGAAAAVALFRFRVGVIPVIAAAAVAGVVASAALSGTR